VNGYCSGMWRLQPFWAKCCWWMKHLSHGMGISVLVTSTWAYVNPLSFQETLFQQQFSISVWAWMVCDIDRYELLPQLSGASHLQLLSEQLLQLLAYVPMATQQTMWILHDFLFPLFLWCHGVFRQPLPKLMDSMKQRKFVHSLDPIKSHLDKLSCLLFFMHTSFFPSLWKPTINSLQSPHPSSRGS
jgi:hypothetical protein